ncbi:putative membrane protein YedE/YeeE [Pseudomonas brassicacearum]|uniref:Membrane protein YedE/YeeE n=1 Tax=Pseudomonas brassicacearum TaxID=930166 RepID=A0AAW8M861_9PSED|nr:putative membrane protein YedE/YeeE [Pseudomonas brassicacearum]
MACWGIAGICPGPAVAILLTGHWQILVFMLAMQAGMSLFTALEARRSR